MRKVKFLLTITLLLLISNLYNFIKLLIFSTYSDQILPHDSEYSSLFEMPSWWLGNALFVILCASLIFISLGLWKIIKKSYFSNEVARYLKNGAIILFLAGMINLFNDISNSIPLTNWVKIYSLSMDSIMIIISCAILIFVDAINKGTSLKIENDLTI
jgi:hypothetical protein